MTEAKYFRKSSSMDKIHPKLDDWKLKQKEKKKNKTKKQP